MGYLRISALKLNIMARNKTYFCAIVIFLETIMRRSFLTLLALTISSHASAGVFSITGPVIQNGSPTSSMILTKSFGMGAARENRASEVHWSDAPKGTKSYLVALYDEHAPTGVGFMHWVVEDIPAGADRLSAATILVNGLETRTDMGIPGYVGVCPPLGSKHNSVLTVRPLDVTRLPAGADTTPALAGFMAPDHIVESTSIRFTCGG